MATPRSGSRSVARLFDGRGLLPPDEHAEPTIVVQAWPVPPTPAEPPRARPPPRRSAVRRDPENPLAALKTTSRADYVYRPARGAPGRRRRCPVPDHRRLPLGGDVGERLPRSAGRCRTELATPALACAILPGTTRSWILAWASACRARAERGLADAVPTWQRPTRRSCARALPASCRSPGSTDDPIGDGRPGAWTLRARSDREAFIRAERRAVRTPAAR